MHTPYTALARRAGGPARRRAIPVLLAVVLALTLTLLTACSGGSTPAPSGSGGQQPAGGAGADPGDTGKIGGELNILVMPGYEEEQIIRPFEEQYGVKVNARVYASSDQMFSILTASQPGEWDVVTPDTPWVEKLVAADLIQPLDPADYPAIEDFYSRWQDFDQVYVDDQMYAIVSRWGYYGIVYNSKYVTPEEAQSIAVMFDPKYEGKVVLFDWYLPNMGMLGRELGLEQPYDATPEQLEQIKARLLELRPQVGAIAATNSDTIQALANETGWLSFGGEWLQVLLKEEGHPIEIAVPEEGGVSWTESFAILKDSQNPEAARAFVQYMLTPEVQAKLAWADAFHAPVPNTRAVEHLTAEQAQMLGLDDPEGMERLLERIATRKVPENEETWQRIWEEFKAR